MSKHFPDDFYQSQKQVLLNMKTKLMNSVKSPVEDLLVSSDQVVEDGDQAQAYISQNLSFGLKERDIKRLREIELALEKIDNGVYGICEEYDEPIEQKRLEKMPWARYCVQAAEELERDSSRRIA